MFRPGPWPHGKPKVEGPPPLSPHEQEARQAAKDLQETWREEDKWAEVANRPKLWNRTVRGAVNPEQYTRGE